ncbi:MAG: hypothetical protein KKC55_15515 [Gammaproteobacteria bacterium]|nr:hypothetical protein [Gammaproteobacteria bacterium]
MNKDEYLNKFAEKLSITIEEVESEFRKLYADEVMIHTDLSEEQQEQRALQRLALLYKKQLRSPAIGFEGIIIAASDCVDITLRQKREATELFKTDPQTAINEGITNEDGVPLDTRKEWGDGRANPQYGKPLPETNFLRNIWGIAKTKEGQPRFFNMVLSGKLAENEDIPVFKPVRFMAIDRGEKLNPSTFTKFVIDEKLEIPEYNGLLNQFMRYYPIEELEDYHNNVKDDFNRLVAVEGDVSMLNLTPTAFGSRVMVLEDAQSLEDLDAKNLTCWIPNRINIDFAEGSKVIVIGRTAQGKKRDEQGNITEEPGDITLNCYGLYVLPEYKISLPDEIQPITEESLDIE